MIDSFEMLRDGIEGANWIRLRWRLIESLPAGTTDRPKVESLVRVFQHGTGHDAAVDHAVAVLASGKRNVTSDP